MASTNSIGLVLVGHGSRSQDWVQALNTLSTHVKRRTRFPIVESAFMSINEPTLQQGLINAVENGARKIVVVPVFVALGSHAKEDIPRLINEAQNTEELLRDIEIVLAEPIGADERLVDILFDKISAALGGAKLVEPSVNVELSTKAGERIMDESLRIVREKIHALVGSLPPDVYPIVERVVHATADPEYAKLLRFSPQAVDSGIDAIREGLPIVTDVDMVKAGINKEKLRVFANDVLNFIDHPTTLSLAKKQGITRSAAAIRVALESGYTKSIFAIGNAPTAAVELATLVEVEKAKPALIIATPIGFVGAAEAKERVTRLTVPNIIVTGEKGGSSVAASIINALLSMAKP